MPLSRSRVAAAAAFLAQGLILLSLTTRLPEFQDAWDLSDVTLSLVLLMMILLAGPAPSSPRRWPSGATAR